jgi:uncharacterized membrane protein
MRCPKCSNIESSLSNYCSECGTPLIDNKQNPPPILNRNFYFVIMLSIILLLVGVILYQVLLKGHLNQSIAPDEITNIASDEVKAIESADEAVIITGPCPISFGEPKYIRDSIGNEEFFVQLTNNSDHPIKEVHFAVAFWDKDNLPIKVQFGYDEYLSCRYSNAIASGETTPSGVRWSIYNQSGKDIVSSVIVVEKVVFFEKEDWVNTKYSEELEKYVGKIRK